MTYRRRVDTRDNHILNIASQEDVLLALVGNRIGEGVFREVYELPGRPDVVLKVQVGVSHCNVMEWTLWDHAQDTRAGKWLAPCVSISQRGGALIQKRTTPISDRVWNSLEVPCWIDDVKQENFGMYQGRPVCHDYGFLHGVLRRGVAANRLVPAVPAWARK